MKESWISDACAIGTARRVELVSADAAAAMPTLAGLGLAAARYAHTVTAYPRKGSKGETLVVVVVADGQGQQLARSTFATDAGPQRVCEAALRESVLERITKYRADPTHRETRIQAMVSPRASEELSAFERERAAITGSA